MKPDVRRGFKDIRVLFDILSNGVRWSAPSTAARRR
jgi:hypothetical protein